MNQVYINILDNQYDWNIKDQINQIKEKASFPEDPSEVLLRKPSLNGEVPGYSVYTNTCVYSVYSVHHRSYLSVFIRSLIHGIQGLIVLLPQSMFTISLFLSVSSSFSIPYTSSRKFVNIGVHCVRFAYIKCKPCNVHYFLIFIIITIIISSSSSIIFI